MQWLHVVFIYHGLQPISLYHGTHFRVLGSSDVLSYDHVWSLWSSHDVILCENDPCTVFVLCEFILPNCSGKIRQVYAKLWTEHCKSVRRICLQKCIHGFVRNFRPYVWYLGILFFCLFFNLVITCDACDISISTIWTHGLTVILLYS